MRKLVSVLLTLAVALSLGLLPAVASANPGGSTELTTEGNGTSEWTTEQAYSPTHSVKLTLPANYTTVDYAHAGITISGKTLNQVSASELSYWYYPSTVSIASLAALHIKDYEGDPTTAYFASYLVFELDADGLGGADTWVIQYEGFSQNTGWQKDIVSDVGELFHIVSIVPEYSYLYGTAQAGGTLTEVKAVTGPDGGATTLGEAQVLKVKIETGGWNSVSQGIVDTAVVSYVDDITINGVTYLEPSATVGLSAEIEEITAISVNPTSLDYHTISPGYDYTNNLTVSNTGSVPVSVTTEITGDTLFTTCLTLEPATINPLKHGSPVIVGAHLQVPLSYHAQGLETGTIIFEATAL